MSLSYTCTVRKISTGYKVCAFQGDSLDHLHSIGATLMQSTHYGRCYVVCVDWQGNTVFSLQPQAVSGVARLSAVRVVPALPVPAPIPPLPDWDRYRADRHAQARAYALLPGYRRPAPPPAVMDAVVVHALPPRR